MPHPTDCWPPCWPSDIRPKHPNLTVIADSEPVHPPHQNLHTACQLLNSCTTERGQAGAGILDAGVLGGCFSTHAVQWTAALATCQWVTTTSHSCTVHECAACHHGAVPAHVPTLSVRMFALVSLLCCSLLTADFPPPWT